jgi:hypothetical protein
MFDSFVTDHDGRIDARELGCIVSPTKSFTSVMVIVEPINREELQSHKIDVVTMGFLLVHMLI